MLPCLHAAVLASMLPCCRRYAAHRNYNRCEHRTLHIGALMALMARGLRRRCMQALALTPLKSEEEPLYKRLAVGDAVRARWKEDDVWYCMER